MTLPLFPIALGDVVSLPATDLANSQTVGGTAVAQYELNTSGKRRETTLNNVVNTIGDWVTPNGSAANYECFATVTGGAPTTGTTGAWLALSSTRTWTLVKTGGAANAEITVQIRRIGTATILATSVVSMHADTLG